MRDRERHVAGTLQRALLPPHLPRMAGAQLAARYVPAEHGVGGDWYDAFELPGGRLGLAVGDVVGHGVDAAATAVRLRDELRGFVLQGRDPAGVVAALDALAADERHGAYSSVLYAELDVKCGARAGRRPATCRRCWCATASRACSSPRAARCSAPSRCRRGRSAPRR